MIDIAGSNDWFSCHWSFLWAFRLFLYFSLFRILIKLMMIINIRLCSNTLSLYSNTMPGRLKLPTAICSKSQLVHKKCNSPNSSWLSFHLQIPIRGNLSRKPSHKNIHLNLTSLWKWWAKRSSKNMKRRSTNLTVRIKSQANLIISLYPGTHLNLRELNLKKWLCKIWVVWGCSPNIYQFLIWGRLKKFSISTGRPD